MSYYPRKCQYVHVSSPTFADFDLMKNINHPMGPPTDLLPVRHRKAITLCNNHILPSPGSTLLLLHLTKGILHLEAIITVPHHHLQRMPTGKLQATMAGLLQDHPPLDLTQGRRRPEWV